MNFYFKQNWVFKNLLRVQTFIRSPDFFRRNLDIYRTQLVFRKQDGLLNNTFNQSVLILHIMTLVLSL